MSVPFAAAAGTAPTSAAAEIVLKSFAKESAAWVAVNVERSPAENLLGVKSTGAKVRPAWPLPRAYAVLLGD